MLRIILAAVAAMYLVNNPAIAGNLFIASADAPHFETYKVKTKSIAHPAVNLDHVPESPDDVAKQRLEDALTSQPDFAGHFKVVTWGCGVPCTTGAIVDLVSGKVYAIPASAGGYAHHADSRLLVVSTVTVGEKYIADWIYTEYFVWNGKNFDKVFEEQPAEVNKIPVLPEIIDMTITSAQRD